ncbi:Oidioi.mRNA.OKI2018_I69.chr1.g1545.t1.cds [Oikopleura dioica]|uniref:Oidioi.mRNA.OKI2018_I69.chr1.g1545.t1.cds n=1 Tax=Oikopleura dioica TaxID=34765 RepID=A0ABN7SSH6_OIKDI|nr:Oidioi.mRNA.OKI2018_I69.chr1.g1545.t1.cds [Oikopleura dioica]
MEELLEHEIQWRYLINLCGEDFPLKTNSEIVDHLKSIYPKNSINQYPMPENKLKRYKYHWSIRRQFFHEYKYVPQITFWRKSPPPNNVQIFGGLAYLMVTREFVSWMMEDEEVKQLIEWSKDTFSPDEFVWASIVAMERAPGGRTGNSKEWSRLILWTNGGSLPQCQGHARRGVCVFGSGDLAWITSRPHMFANKFDDQDDFAIQCLEEELKRRNDDRELVKNS